MHNRCGVVSNTTIKWLKRRKYTHEIHVNLQHRVQTQSNAATTTTTTATTATATTTTLTRWAAAFA